MELFDAPVQLNLYLSNQLESDAGMTKAGRALETFVRDVIQRDQIPRELKKAEFRKVANLITVAIELTDGSRKERCWSEQELLSMAEPITTPICELLHEMVR